MAGQDGDAEQEIVESLLAVEVGMTRQSSSVVQRVWDRKNRRWQHRIVRQFVKTRLGRKRKPTATELLFARSV